MSTAISRITGPTGGALAALEETTVNDVVSYSNRGMADGGMLLPTTPEFAAQVAAVHAAAKADMAGADPEAIREFLQVFCDRRGLTMPTGFALDLDIGIMASWPADLFHLAARRLWERFGDLRVPNPPDFFRYIEEDLAERKRQLAAIHTLEKRLENIARRGGVQIHPDRFDPPPSKE